MNLKITSFLFFVILFSCKENTSTNISDKITDSTNKIISDSISKLPEYNQEQNLNQILETQEIEKPDYKFVAESYHIFVLDENNDTLKFDDEKDYFAFPYLKEAYYARHLTHLFPYYKRKIKNEKLNPYSKENLDFLNSKINLVFQVPLNTYDEELNEIFNKLYYDYKDYDVYPMEKGYGFQTFYLGNDIREVKMDIRRNYKNGNLEIN